MTNRATGAEAGTADGLLLVPNSPREPRNSPDLFKHLDGGVACQGSDQVHYFHQDGGQEEAGHDLC